MINLKHLIFGAGGKCAEDLAPAVRQAVEAWQAVSQPDLNHPHYHTRYVVVDVATTGLDPDRDKILGIAGVALGQGGILLPEDACALDLADGAGPEDTRRRLAAFLSFLGPGPLVTCQVDFVAGFLGRFMKDELGMAFEASWLDLSWLLPDLFKERIDRMASMDDWLAAFGLEAPQGRDALARSVAMARLLQMALPRAVERGGDTPGKLIDFAESRRRLRPNC